MQSAKAHFLSSTRSAGVGLGWVGWGRTNECGKKSVVVVAGQRIQSINLRDDIKGTRFFFIISF